MHASLHIASPITLQWVGDKKERKQAKEKKKEKADTELLSIARLVLLHLHCLCVSFICMRAEGGRERGREGGRKDGGEGGRR